MSTQLPGKHYIEVAVPTDRLVSHSVVVLSALNPDGEIELYTFTNGDSTMTQYLGLLEYGKHIVLKWNDKEQ